MKRSRALQLARQHLRNLAPSRLWKSAHPVERASQLLDVDVSTASGNHVGRAQPHDDANRERELWERRGGREVADRDEGEGRAYLFLQGVHARAKIDGLIEC